MWVSNSPRKVIVARVLDAEAKAVTVVLAHRRVSTMPLTFFLTGSTHAPGASRRTYKSSSKKKWLAYQTMCLGFHTTQRRPEAFRFSKPKKIFTVLSTCRTTTRLTGIESPGWRLFTDGGLDATSKAQKSPAGGDVIVSPDKFVRVICGPVVCDPPLPAFLGATGPRPAATTPLSL